MFDGDALDGQLQQSIAEFLDSRTIVGDREVLVEGVDMDVEFVLGYIDTDADTGTCSNWVHGEVPFLQMRAGARGSIPATALSAVPGATLRFAPGTATPSIEPCFWFLGNIQGHDGH